MNRLKLMRGVALTATLVVAASACGEREVDRTPDTMAADTMAPRPQRADGTADMGRDSAMTGGMREGAGMQARSITTADRPPYGKYLTDGQGRALYVFTADTKGESSACYDTCAAAWPPVTGNPTTMDAATLDKSKLGTIERRGGSKQLTFNGWPLYYFQRDGSSQEVNGQDVHSFEGEWYLVSPSGTMNKAKA